MTIEEALTRIQQRREWACRETDARYYTRGLLHTTLDDADALAAEVRRLRQRHAEELGNRKCIWAESNGDAEFWHTSCDQDFVFIEGTPGENGMKFCCYCGANLVEKKWEEPPDAEDLSTV